MFLSTELTTPNPTISVPHGRGAGATLCPRGRRTPRFARSWVTQNMLLGCGEWSWKLKTGQSYIFCILPSGYVKIATENCHLQVMYVLKMVIFHSYVSYLPLIYLLFEWFSIAVLVWTHPRPIMLVERIGSVQAWRTIVGLVQHIEGMGLVVRK